MENGHLAKFLKTNQAPFLETIVYVRCPRRGYDCSKATDPGRQDLCRNTCEHEDARSLWKLSKNLWLNVLLESTENVDSPLAASLPLK